MEMSEDLHIHPLIQMSQTFGSQKDTSDSEDEEEIQFGEPKLKISFKENKKVSTEDNEKRRQVRLMKNRQSAALSRQRKKEYIGNLQKQVTRVIQENTNYQVQLAKLTNQSWENKLIVERLEKDILKLVNENNELRSRMKEVGVPADDIKRTCVELNICDVATVIHTATIVQPTDLVDEQEKTQ